MAKTKKYNCTKGGKQYYRITRTIDGKKKEFYGDGKRDAEKKLEAYILKKSREEAERKSLLDRGFGLVAADTLFGDGLKDWLFNVKRYNCKKLSTFDRYELMWRKQVVGCGLCSTCLLCESNISEVNRSLIKSCVRKMERDPNKTPGNIECFLTVLKLYFEFLIDEEVIPDNNPCRKLKPTKAPQIEDEPEKKYIDKELRTKLKNALDDESEVFRMALLLDFNSGLRQGELCGLEWDRDVIWDAGIMVRQTVSYPRVFDDEGNHRRMITIQAPKGGRARFVALPEYVWPILREYQDWQRVEYMKNGWGKPKMVLHGQNGGILIPKSLRTAFLKVQKKCGIEDMKRFHDIRHSYITDLAVDENIPLPVVQSTAGHTDLKITEKYIHTKPTKNASILKNIVAF